MGVMDVYDSATHSENLMFAAGLLKVSPESLNEKPLLEDAATYFWCGGRGGSALIVGDDGTVLFANSSVPFDAHLAEFKAGKRTPLDYFS